MMNSPSSPAIRGGEAVKTETDIDEVVIKEEPRIVPLEGGDPVFGIVEEDPLKTDVRIKEEDIYFDESESIPGGTIFKTEGSEDTFLETQVTLKCETQGCLKDEAEENPYLDLDPEDEEAYQDFLEDSGGPSDQGHIFTGAGQFSCHHCGSTYHKKSLLAVHVASHLGKSPKLQAVKRVLCPQCDYRCFHPNGLKLHMLTHVHLSLQCPDCEYKAKHQNALKVHSATHDGIVYKCRHCSYKSTNRHNFKMHDLRNHTRGVANGKCHFCNYSSGFFSVEYHEKSKHRGEFYPCSQCPVKFPKRIELRRHIFSEHSLLFKCYHCDFATPIRRNLLRHVLSHMNPKLKCCHCGATFPNVNSRFLHLQSNHKGATKSKARKTAKPVFFTMDQL